MKKAKKDSNLGMNRTGMGMAPKEGKLQEENAWKAVPAASGDAGELRSLRASYEADAEPVGSVPPPSSLKGMAKSALQMGMGRDPVGFIDKLGERLAYERAGTRLFELLIGKFESGNSPTGEADLETLVRFRNQELSHFKMLWDCVEKLGADPTVQTPSADVSGVKAQGLVATLSDPRTTFAHALDAMLIAELTDNEGWRMLIDLAEGMGQKEMVDNFNIALADENIHLEHIRRWWSRLIKEEAGVEESVLTP